MSQELTSEKNAIFPGLRACKNVCTIYLLDCHQGHYSRGIRGLQLPKSWLGLLMYSNPQNCHCIKTKAKFTSTSIFIYNLSVL